jgi:diguanylate cyclase (GGDEF)-like protein
VSLLPRETMRAWLKSTRKSIASVLARSIYVCVKTFRAIVGGDRTARQVEFRMANPLRREAAPNLSKLRDDVDLGRAAAEIARLRGELEGQARLIRQQAAALAHSRKIFERASAAAKIGVWQCSLPDETLTWTDQVYDIFEISREAALSREQILEFYAPASLRALQAVRDKAIAERGGFSLDAEITTGTGRRRWIRLTATVECEGCVPVRIFGMKQDITEEKALNERLRYLADFDPLTGLANRSAFQAKLAAAQERAADEVSFGALLLVDLDGFKQINDTFGHASGDEFLKSVAERLANVCRDPDFVARLGGDEFAVLLRARPTQDEIENVAEQILEALRAPVEGFDWPFKVGASVGIARIDASTPVELFKKADAALYAAKAAGRDTFRIFGSVGSDALFMPQNAPPYSAIGPRTFMLRRSS